MPLSSEGAVWALKRSGYVGGSAASVMPLQSAAGRSSQPSVGIVPADARGATPGASRPDAEVLSPGVSDASPDAPLSTDDKSVEFGVAGSVPTLLCNHILSCRCCASRCNPSEPEAPEPISNRSCSQLLGATKRLSTLKLFSAYYCRGMCSEWIVALKVLRPEAATDMRRKEGNYLVPKLRPPARSVIAMCSKLSCAKAPLMLYTKRQQRQEEKPPNTKTM